MVCRCFVKLDNSQPSEYCNLQPKKFINIKSINIVEIKAVLWHRGRQRKLVTAIREAAKKSLSGPATKAFSTPPLGLVVIGTFFLTLKKGNFFLSGTPV